MFIQITTRGFSLTKALRNYVTSRLEFTLERYRDYLQTVEVTLLDVNGPRGGEDMRCRLQLKPRSGRSVIIQETADDLYDAVAICASRARWVIGRQLDKSQNKKRRLMKGFSGYNFDIEDMENHLLGAERLSHKEVEKVS